MENTEKMEIETPIGTIVAYKSTDPDYPGVFIDLRRPGTKFLTSVACVEYDSAREGIMARVWGDAKREDTTHDLLIENL